MYQNPNPLQLKAIHTHAYGKKLHYFFLFTTLLCITLLLSIPKICAQNQGVTFMQTEMNWNQLIQKAKNEHKLLFIYVFENNSTACSHIEDYVFNNSKVTTTHNKYCINYKIDGQANSSRDFIHDFGIKTLPTFLFFDINENLLKQSSGTPPPMGYLKMMQEVIDTQYNTPDIGRGNLETQSVFDNKMYTIPSPNYHNQPKTATPLEETTQKTVNISPPLQNANRNLPTQANKWEEAYYKRQITADDLRKYAYWLKGQKESYHAVVNDYLQTQKGKLQEHINRQFLFDFSESTENDAIKLFMKDIHHFKATQGSERINDRIKNAVRNSVLTAIREHDHAIFQDAIEVIQRAELPFKDDFEFEMKIGYFRGVGDWRDYAETAIAYINSKNTTNPKLLNEMAFQIALNLDDLNYLQQALSWAKKTVKIETEYHYNYTLAFIYYRLNEFDIALKVAEYAQKLGELRKINPKEVNKLIDKIRAR